MKCGHMGQALDLNTLSYVMDEAIATSDFTLPIQRLTACHRLKTAIPAGCMARIGAIIGGGSKEQVRCFCLMFSSAVWVLFGCSVAVVLWHLCFPASRHSGVVRGDVACQVDALGIYFEEIGLAFQIMDDVVNLRGIEVCLRRMSSCPAALQTVLSVAACRCLLLPRLPAVASHVPPSMSASVCALQEQGSLLKTRGEDLMMGKVTFPMLKAIGLIPDSEIKDMWAIVRAAPFSASAAPFRVAVLCTCVLYAAAVLVG